MGSETVRLWSDCLGTLNLMLPNASRTELQVAAVTAAGDLMQVILQQPKKQPVLPKAKWKELVQDMKVPSKLGEALTKSVQHPQPLNSVTVAVLDLLMLLLTRGDADGIVTAASVNENSIASRTRCQLEQSGVPQALSALLTAAAAALPGEPAPFTPEQCSNTAGGSNAPAAATAAAGACAAGPTAESHHAGGRSSGGGGDSPDPSPVLKSAERSLMLVAALVRVWPDGTPLHRLSISLAGPMCLLSVACIHYVSAHVQGWQQPQKDQAFGLQTLLHRAVTVPLTVLSWRCGCMPEFVDAGIRGDAPLPGLPELLHNMHFILCLVLCNSVMALSLLLQDQQQGSSNSVNTGGSSSSQGSSGSKSGGKPTKRNKSSKGDAGASRTGAGSSSSSSSTAAAAAAASAASGSSAAGGTKREQDLAKHARMRAAVEGMRPEFGVQSLASWVRGCQLLPLLTSSHTKLFELLDVDPRVVLWAAESLTKTWAGIEERVSLYDGLGDMSRLYRQVFDGMLSPNGQAAAVLQEHTQLLPAAHMQRERLFVLLVPLVLLHTAANLPTGKGKEADLVACMCAAAFSTPVLIHWDRLVQLLPRVPGDQWMQSRLPPVWVDDTISVMLQLATAMLAGVRRSQIPPAAADVATAKAGIAARGDSSSSGNGVSSSSSSSSASRSVSASLQYAKDCVHRMQALESTVMTLWQVLTHCAKAAAACTEQLQAAAVPGVPAPTLCLNSPMPRQFQAALAAAPKAVRALEGYLRLLGMGFEGLHTSKSLTGWVGVILSCRDVLGTNAVVGLTWGGGWELQRYVYSMLSSSVKLARMQAGMLQGQLSWELCYSSCCTAAALLQQHPEWPQVLLALPDAAAPSAAAEEEAAGGARQQQILQVLRRQKAL